MTADAWETIARREPYFGVLSAPQFRAGVMDEAAIESFYETGRADIARLAGWMREDVGAGADFARALDIGCGVGRLALPMAARAREVWGFDPAASMLALAEARAARAGVANARFVGELPDGPFDWINSYIVFQHIAPRDGLALLDAALARLAPGGVATLHFAFWRDAARAEPATPVSRAGAVIIRMMARAGRAPAERLIRMHDYSLSEVLARFARAGCARCVLRHTDHDGHRGAWVIARRKTAPA